MQRAVEHLVAIVRPGIPAPSLQSYEVGVPAFLQELREVTEIEEGHRCRGGENAGGALRGGDEAARWGRTEKGLGMVVIGWGERARGGSVAEDMRGV